MHASTEKSVHRSKRRNAAVKRSFAPLRLTARSAGTELDLSEPPRTAQRQPEPPPRAVRLHVADDGAGSGNRHDLHLLGPGIEGDHVPRPGLAVPDAPIGPDRDAVWARVGRRGAPL